MSPRRDRSIAPRPGERLHGLALFVSAFLLFWAQPLLARMVLPLLGGVPAVWSTVMVFFQAALLAGYLYAHLVSRLRPRLQLTVHAVLVAAAVPFLPLQLDAALGQPASGGTALRLLVALGAAVGVPALVVASTAPLLQRWFSRTGRPGAEDPYFLYGASNAGSLAALIGFPSLIEPALALRHQAWAWSGGFLLLAALTFLCGRAHWPRRLAEPGDQAGHNDRELPAAGVQVRWLLLAFAPSSLLLGATTHLTTDVASVPLLWVVPLALYLLTYVMAFSRRTVLSGRWVMGAQAACVVLLAVVLAHAVPRVEKSAVLFPVHLAAFFLTALVCHRELARLRPAARHLTRYYLVLAAGGVLGGVFNTLLAPQIFQSFAEYPLVLIAACLLRPAPAPGGGPRVRVLDVAIPAGIFTTLAAAGLAVGGGETGRWVLFGLGGAACLIAAGRPLRFGLALAALVVAGRLSHPPLGERLAAERNFFGPVEVIGAGGARILYHGKTIHGAQVTTGRHGATPLAYYTTAGPLGDVFRAIAPRLERSRIAVLGLGSGAIAAYGRPGQEMVFHEINPAVARIATDPRLFTYLADSPASITVRVGDGRLGLAQEVQGRYALIVVDAFNSDAVPVHLLTREAIGLYLARLAPGGVVLFNATNDYLDLEGVLGRAAADAGLAALVRCDEEAVTATEDIPFKLPSDWVALARSAADLGALSATPGWRPPRYRPAQRPWTDDRASLLGAFRGL